MKRILFQHLTTMTSMFIYLEVGEFYYKLPKKQIIYGFIILIKNK